MPPPKKPSRPKLALVRSPTGADAPRAKSSPRASAATLADLGAFKPLELYPCGKWNPKESGWAESDEPAPEWFLPMRAQGPRPLFEMEQVRPCLKPGEFESDMVYAALECLREDDKTAATALLERALAEDVRCLDAHAHLGLLFFDDDPAAARPHFERGVAIGDASVGHDFDGVLVWGLHDNRPYLRCLHGAALCAWRLGDFRKAIAAFERLLWLNPDDNQGVRFCLAAARRGKKWKRDLM